MVATYTPSLRLTKQGDNDNPNTWGQILNQQVIDLVEEAVSGVVDVDCTGSSDIDISTTVVNGGTDTARHAVLELSGTLGSDINLIVPSVEKVYLINAKQSGGYDITVKPSGGTGITLSSGQKALVYCNGTDIISVSSGALLAANNLSDLVSASTARSNLGLGNLATLNAGSGLTINGSNLDVNGVTPIGAVSMYISNTAPSKWLNCDGSAVSRTTYAALYAIIGDIYGAGDGSTTFNLPDFRGRMPIGIGQGNTAEGGLTGTNRSLADSGGAETHTLTEAEMPSHTHDIVGYSVATANKPVKVVIDDDVSTNQFTQTTEVTGGDQDHNNMPPYMGVNFIIYAGV